MTGRSYVTLHAGDLGSPGPAVGSLGPDGTITWANGGTREIIDVSRVWDAARGGEVACETPLLVEGVVHLCGTCDPCQMRAELATAAAIIETVERR